MRTATTRPVVLTTLVVVVGATLATGREASAHGLDARRVTVQLDGTRARLEVTPLAAALPAFDDDGDGNLGAAEIARHREALRAHYLERVTVVDERERPSELSFFDVVVPGGVEEDPSGQAHVSFRAQHVFTEPPEGLVLDVDLFAPGPEAALEVSAGRGPVIERTVLSPSASRAVFFVDDLRAKEALLSGAGTGTSPSALRVVLAAVLVAVGAAAVLLALVRGRGR